MLLNEKLKKLRKDRMLTQEKLAEEINVSRQAITKWESGEGIPDIENIKQICKYFNISIDELIKEESDIQLNKINTNSFIKEVNIEHCKHFDIRVKNFNLLELISNKEEKVKIEISSKSDNYIDKFINIKIDDKKDLGNRFDLKIINKSKLNDLNVKIYLPQKYINELEVNADLRTINIIGLTLEKFEFDGYVKYVNVQNSQGLLVLNTTRADVEINYDRFDGRLEVNLVTSIARVTVPKKSKYRTENIGKKTVIIDSIETENSKNVIELNGIDSKLIMIHK